MNKIVLSILECKYTKTAFSKELDLKWVKKSPTRFWLELRVIQMYNYKNYVHKHGDDFSLKLKACTHLNMFYK